MSAQSQFQKVQKKLLLKLLVELDTAGEFDFDNPYEGELYQDNETALIKVVKKYGFYPILDLDVQFFGQLKNLNKDILQIWYRTKDRGIAEDLLVPVCKRWNVDYRVRGSEYFVDHYVDSFDCYRKDWVHDMVYQLNSNGIWSYYDGRLVERDVRDSDSEGYEIDDVYVVDETPQQGLSENHRKNKIRETQQIINNLDKKTLLQIKEMIDRKLGII